MVNLTHILQRITLRYGQVMQRMLDPQGTGADLSAWERVPTQSPTPTAEALSAVQPPTTQGGLPDHGLGVDTYRRMQAADPHLQAGTPLGDMLRAVRIEAGPLQDWAATHPTPHTYRVELWVDGTLRRTITTDMQGCAPTLDIHQGRTMEDWADQGRRPTCTHFSVTTCD